MAFRYSTHIYSLASLSSTVGHPMESSMAYPITSTITFTPVCAVVRLSTVTGAACKCGKFTLRPSAIQIKTLAMGEVRQIVASGYKLTHGQPLASITWT